MSLTIFLNELSQLSLFSSSSALFTKLSYRALLTLSGFPSPFTSLSTASTPFRPTASFLSSSTCVPASLFPSL